MLATCAGLAVALVIQVGAFFIFTDAHALSDVVHLFHLRGVRPWAPPYFDRVLEYPVGIGFVMYLISFVGGGALGFFFAGAVISGVLAVVVTIVLEARGSAHVLRWAFGLPLLLYVFLNFDMLAIAPLLVGLLAYERDRDSMAGVAIGLGAAAKLFPGAALIPLAAARLAQGRRRDAARLLVSAGGVIALVNLPVLLAAPHNWWWTAHFQGKRPPTWGSLWHYAFRLPGVTPLVSGHAAPIANVVSIVALGAGLAMLTRLAVRRSLGPFEIAAAATGIFLLTNKVYSPVYDLWLVPFFAALAIPRMRWLVYCVAEAGVFFLVYGHTRLGFSAEITKNVLPLFVFARAAVIASVIVFATQDRARRRPPVGVGARTRRAPSTGRTHTPRRLRPERSDSHALDRDTARR